MINEVEAHGARGERQRINALFAPAPNNYNADDMCSLKLSNFGVGEGSMK
jgi:hypothetical protein